MNENREAAQSAYIPDWCQKINFGETPAFVLKVIDATHIGIWDWNLIDDRFAVNDEWAHMLGYEVDTMSGYIDSWRNRLHHEDYERVNQTVDKYLSGEIEIYDVQYKMIKSDGSIIWVQEKGVASEWDCTGKPIRFIGTMQDITLHKETERKLENIHLRSKHLENEIQSAVTKNKLTDDLLHVQSKVATLLLAADQEDHAAAVIEALGLLGQAVHTDRVCIYKNFNEDEKLCGKLIYHFNSMEENVHIKRNILSTFNYDDDFPNWKALLLNGECINQIDINVTDTERIIFAKLSICSLLIVPLIYKQELWGCITFADSNKRRLFTETEVKSMTSGGTSLVFSMTRNEMTLNLIAAKEAALESIRAKSLFLANMSHELRTPMNAILGMSAVARKSQGNFDKINDCFNKIDSASKLLLGIINDVLDMSKIESQRLEFTFAEFSLRKAIQNICDIQEDAAHIKRHQLCFSIDDNIPETLVGDEFRLSQVLNNLVSNAIKFTPDGGNIQVDVKEQDYEENISTLLISVSDNGIGIAPDNIDHIFNAFEQENSGTIRGYGGTGLGLSISKNIVERMNGRIWAESVPGSGSTFYFTVKMERAPDSTGADESACDSISYDFTGKHFLLVEDIEINQMIIEDLLEPYGAVVDCADNGLQALDLLTSQSCSYDLILMDIQMPIMDGLEATRKIRALNNDDISELPIIAVTANAFPEDVDRCFNAGMNDYISKPIDVDTMMNIISRYVM